MKREYELTADEYARLRDASQPVRYLVVGGVEPRSPYDTACDFWRALGAARGFKWDTAGPAPGKPDRFFLAEPMEVN